MGLGPTLEMDGAPLVVTAWAQPEAIAVRQLLITCGGEPLRGEFDLQANPWARRPTLHDMIKHL